MTSTNHIELMYNFFLTGEMQLHLQAMVNLLRDEDVLRLVCVILYTKIVQFGGGRV